MVCFDDVLKREIYVFDECYHRLCRSCTNNYFLEQINNGNIFSKGSSIGLKCPTQNCNQLLGIHEIRNIVDKKTFERYDTMLRDQALEKIQDIVWCPTKGCSNALIREGKSPMLVCYVCKHTHCNNCKIPWHTNLTCTEYNGILKQKEEKLEKEKTNELAAQVWITLKTKPCPACKTPIEKNGGCNHMTCMKCRYEFCWLCGTKYANNHFSNSKCKQFS